MLFCQFTKQEGNIITCSGIILIPVRSLTEPTTHQKLPCPLCSLIFDLEHTSALLAKFC